MTDRVEKSFNSIRLHRRTRRRICLKFFKIFRLQSKTCALITFHMIVITKYTKGEKYNKGIVTYNSLLTKWGRLKKGRRIRLRRTSEFHHICFSNSLPKTAFIVWFTPIISYSDSDVETTNIDSVKPALKGKKWVVALLG